MYLSQAGPPPKKKPSIFFFNGWQFDDFRKIFLGRDVVQHPIWNACHFINRRPSGCRRIFHF